MNDDRLTNLEARFAWLERHVAEQDKAMVELGEELQRLRREIEAWRERARAAEGPVDRAAADEPPPPHY